MKLSIVIVNYNVEHFLEQCLHSVYTALEGIDGEVWVVDNNSVDGSLAMLKRKFPQTKVIANKENVGFARANNQALRQAQGEYVLLLNPDTLVEPDTFGKCLDFMDHTPDAGGLGVKMINGNGEFLPESKRGLPVPSVAFYKIFGLSKLFPKSKRFGAYHLTYLSPDEIHSVDVLSGAFMLMRKSVLDQVGLLDEDYFMYGEDIDLSYRITQGGYKNYYFPETRIIHYKGESTKKSSVNYVYVFYNAMRIFANKHFSQKNAKLFNWLITLAIWFRAALALLSRLFQAILLPIIDFAAIYGGMYALSLYWDANILSARNSGFPPIYRQVFIPLYILIWIVSMACCGSYKKPVTATKSNKGILIGTVIILLIYALLPETYRFSRAVTILGAMWTMLVVNLIRYLMRRFNIGSTLFGGKDKRRIAVIGQGEEAARVAALVRIVNKKCDFTGIVRSGEQQEDPQTQSNFQQLGHIGQLKDIISIYRINEVVFCSKDISADNIISLMTQLQESQVEYKIAPEESDSIIGSNSISTYDEIYGIHVNSITKAGNRRKKRLFDMVASCLLLLFLWADIWFVQKKKTFVRNIFDVLTGKKSWVGCQKLDGEESLPELRPGVLHPSDAFKFSQADPSLIHKVNVTYMQDYSLLTDLNILYRGFKHLGR
ncbi:MAG: glycosyltransferase [Bacteroidales bacterium]|nr:glycosyltransferase [Bacteroidales bacterium]